MKTSIDIPKEMMSETIKLTGAKTKRDAVITAMGEFNRQRRLEALAERLQGSCPDFMAQANLRRMRQDREWEAKK
jgi:hypothetical protein